MTQDFARVSAGALDRFEQAIEQALDAAGADATVSRRDNVIEIEFDDGSQMVLNSHQAAGELWLASRQGAWHFRPDAGGGPETGNGADAGAAPRWLDTRTGAALEELLAAQLSVHAGVAVTLAARG